MKWCSIGQHEEMHSLSSVLLILWVAENGTKNSCSFPFIYFTCFYTGRVFNIILGLASVTHEVKKEAAANDTLRRKWVGIYGIPANK